MNKSKIALALILVLALQPGCSTADKNWGGDGPEDIRHIFIGTWKGGYVNDAGKTERTWIQKRSADGTYTTDFFHHTERGVYHSRQQGKWWIDGHRFYEIAPQFMKEAEVYQFKIVNRDEIHFKSTTKDYEFTDRRTEDLPNGPGVWL